MSTKSYICKEQTDGSYKGIYCHWDGYLTHNGAMLLDHYSDKEKLNALLELGDIFSYVKTLLPIPLCRMIVKTDRLTLPSPTAEIAARKK